RVVNKGCTDDLYSVVGTVWLEDPLAERTVLDDEGTEIPLTTPAEVLGCCRPRPPRAPVVSATLTLCAPGASTECEALRAGGRRPLRDRAARLPCHRRPGPGRRRLVGDLPGRPDCLPTSAGGRERHRMVGDDRQTQVSRPVPLHRPPDPHAPAAGTPEHRPGDRRVDPGPARSAR